MIGLRLNDNDFLDLYEDTSVELTLRNPIFADDGVIPSSNSIPFDVPVSDKNAAILSRPHVIEHASKFQRQLFSRLFFNGVPWLAGQLNIRNVNEGRYNVNFLSGIKNLGNEFRDARIRDLVDQEIVIDNSPTNKMIAVGFSPLAGDCTFIINGQSYLLHGVTAEAFAADIESNDPTVSMVYHDNSPGQPDFPHPDFPSYVWYEIRHKTDPDNPLSEISVDVDNKEEYKVWVQPFLDEYYTPIKSFLNQYRSATPPDDILRFPVVTNTGAYTIDQKSGAFINLQLNNDFSVNHFNGDWSAQNINSISPYVMFRHVLDKIEEVFNIRLVGDFIDDPDLVDLLWWNGNSIDQFQPFVGETPFIFWRRSFNVNEFVPDITVGDMFKELQKLFCLAIRYIPGEKKIILNYRKNIINNPGYQDITFKAAAVYDDLDNTEKDGLTLRSVNDGDEFEFYEENENPFQEKVIGNGINVIESQIAGVAHKTINLLNITLVTPIYKSEWSNDFQPRLMFYRGLRNDGNGNYAYATRDNGEEYSLEWTSSNGFYEKFWKEWARFLIRRAVVTRNINFNVADLAGIDWEKKYRIDRINYLINSIQVRMTMKGLKAAKVELFKSG